MKTKFAIGVALVGAVILGTVISGFGVAQQTPAATADTSFSDSQENEIRSLIHEYLLDNPEVLIEALNRYQDRERQNAQARLEVGARNNLQALLEGDGGFTVGADPENAKVAVIEFFDYHCGYCKRATGVVQELAKEDPDVKIVFRELPILKKESETAAKYALAAREQGKYADFHFAMMQAQGTLTEDRIKLIAKKTGLNVNALEKAIKTPAITAAVKETRDFAVEMGADGTPTFIVASLDGDFVEVMPGFREEDLRTAIAEAKRD